MLYIWHWPLDMGTAKLHAHTVAYFERWLVAYVRELHHQFGCHLGFSPTSYTSIDVQGSVDQQDGLSNAPWTTLGRSKKWTCKMESQMVEVAASQDVDEVECLDDIQANPSSAHTVPDFTNK